MRRLGAVASAFVLAVLAGAVAPAPAYAVTTRPALVINRNFPDPDVTRFGSTYHAYATNAGGNVPVSTAPAAGGPWTARGDALPTLGAWASTGLTWAPDVSRRADGQYLLYYTARSRAAGRQCIGAAVSGNPLGPFAPVGTAPLVCNTGEAGDIDASSFVDTDGRRYLLYKDDRNAIGQPPSIWLQPVAADGITLQGGRTELLRNDRAEEAGVIEAPVLVRRASRYVLFYSGGPYGNGSYFTGYATSTSITGPYAKAFRPLITTASVDGVVNGPGGADVDVAGGNIFFHGWLPGGGRGMYRADLGWANDLPVVRGSRVRTEAERGTLNRAAVRTGAANASQGAVVAYIDYADSWVDLTVFAPAAGGYTVYVCYAAGFGDAQHRLTVNGGAQIVVNYPQGGWDTYRQVPVDVTLNAGSNVLRFQFLTRWAELDYIEVA